MIARTTFLALLASLAFALVASFAPRASAQDEADASVPTVDAAPPPTATVIPSASSPVPAASDTSDAGVTAPEGAAAPPSEVASRGPGFSSAGGSRIRVGLEVFAQYSVRDVDAPSSNRTWFHQFDVPRVHAAVDGEYEGVRGRVVLEATRSASEGSLIGVAGDSLVLRIREAYASYRPWGAFAIAAGVVPTLTVPELDGTWMMRAVAPSAVEAAGLLSPADLGAKMRFDLPHRYGWIGAGAFNGDGYTSRELNRGKNVESAVELHPLPDGPLLPVGVFASYAVGSTGTTRARADRLTAGLVWQGASIRAGALLTYAWGREQLGTAKGVVASAFARVEPVSRLYLAARYDHVVRDAVNDPTDTVSRILASLGYRIADPLEAFLVFDRSIPSNRAQNELPGSNAWEGRVVARVVF